MLITIEDVPEYLHKSWFYKEISEFESETSGSFEVNELHFKPDLTLNKMDDLIHLLHTLQFWIFDYKNYPYYEIFSFVNQNINLDYSFIYDTFSQQEIVKEIDLLKLFKNNIKNNTKGIWKIAVSKNYLLLLKYLFQIDCYFADKLCEISAKYGSLDCLQFAHENGCQWNADVSCYAAYGHLECLQYAHENGCPWDEDVCSTAAAFGHLDCLKYAHENGCPWDDTTCVNVYIKGSIDCLRYAHENGCPWDKICTMLFAQSGYLDCLQYAHENGCLWDNNTCSNAAKNGHLDCLQYSHEHGCPWNEDVCAAAIENDNKDCFLYAYQNGCPLTANNQSFEVQQKVANWLSNLE